MISSYYFPTVFLLAAYSGPHWPPRAFDSFPHRLVDPEKTLRPTIQPFNGFDVSQIRSVGKIRTSEPEFPPCTLRTSLFLTAVLLPL